MASESRHTREPFEHPASGRRSDPCAKRRTSNTQFQPLLAKWVIDRFERMSGLTAVVVPMGLPESGTPETSFPIPEHPACMEFAGTAYCRQSWQAHLAKLKHQPEVHWHHCKYGKRCAMVPLVRQRQCLAVCKLVCPDTMLICEFEQMVELLDVLMENFACRESGLLEQLIPTNRQSKDDVTQRAEVSESEADGKAAHPQVRAALRYIKKHLTNSNMTVSQIARDLDINVTYLAHLFSLQVGVRMSRYISARRIQLAKTLLATTNWQIKRVAYESGHNNPYWFSEVFREHTGMTPSKFRREARPT